MNKWTAISFAFCLGTALVWIAFLAGLTQASVGHTSKCEPLEQGAVFMVILGLILPLVAGFLAGMDFRRLTQDDE